MTSTWTKGIKPPHNAPLPQGTAPSSWQAGARPQHNSPRCTLEIASGRKSAPPSLPTVNSFEDIAQWDNNQWSELLIYCRPSSGGRRRVRVGRRPRQPPATGPQPVGLVRRQDAIQGSAAPTKFAEHVLARIAHQRVIPRQSHCEHADEFKVFRKGNLTLVIKARWQSVLQRYDKADMLRLQETQIGIRRRIPRARQAARVVGQPVADDQTGQALCRRSADRQRRTADAVEHREVCR